VLEKVQIIEMDIGISGDSVMRHSDYSEEAGVNADSSEGGVSFGLDVD